MDQASLNDIAQLFRTAGRVQSTDPQNLHVESTRYILVSDKLAHSIADRLEHFADHWERRIQSS